MEIANLQTESTPVVRPVQRAERITALDTLRGFALLGILLMNIVAMGVFAGAYDDPTVAGGSTGINLWTWAILYVTAEGKMRCIFSLVFGAGIILLTKRLETTGSDSADIYYRRTLWLLAFGIVHAYLLWLGEVLYPYALCALALYPFRNLPARKLAWIGGVVFVLTSGKYIAAGFDTRETIREGRRAQTVQAQGQTLSEEQKGALHKYEEFLAFSRPTPEQIASDMREWRGTPLSVIKVRAKLVGFFHNKPYYGGFSPDVWCMMLLGMALMKWGVLSAARSTQFYLWMILIGCGIGLPVNSYRAWAIVQSNFDPVVHAFQSVTYDLGRLTVALGYIGIIMLICKSGRLQLLTNALGAVGQTALSNYVAQSVITAFFFTGYGFRMYGQLERYQLYYVVAAIWFFNLVASSIWVRHFRFGPLEWCWRSLTYWKKQPMRLANANA